MDSNLAIALSAKYPDRVVLRTLALWKTHKPNLDTKGCDAGYVGYLIETYGICA